MQELHRLFEANFTCTFFQTQGIEFKLLVGGSGHSGPEETTEPVSQSTNNNCPHRTQLAGEISETQYPHQPCFILYVI